jgi:hypothetical protein
VARALLARVRQGWRPPVRLVGVALELLAPAGEAAAQLSMFDAAPGAPAGAPNDLRGRYGPGVIGPASA